MGAVFGIRRAGRAGARCNPVFGRLSPTRAEQVADLERFRGFGARDALTKALVLRGFSFPAVNLQSGVPQVTALALAHASFLRDDSKQKKDGVPEQRNAALGRLRDLICSSGPSRCKPATCQDRGRALPSDT